MFLRNVYYLITPRQRRLARRAWFFFSDLFSRKHELVPPKGMIYTGAGDFVAVGEKMMNKIIGESKFAPDEMVLDVGCGIGRIARPFTKFISRNGKYYGFDVVPAGIAWCRKNYRDFQHFHFDYVAVNNDLYNTEAGMNASEFRFPYSDRLFDLVISISVFTHMQKAGVENYLSEIARVLKPGKYCFCTFFIMTKERIKQSECKTDFFFQIQIRRILPA